MTVDWSNWLTLTPQQQNALWAQYRQIISAESQQARFNNYKRLNDALYGVR